MDAKSVKADLKLHLKPMRERLEQVASIAKAKTCAEAGMWKGNRDRPRLRAHP
jgi:hypothetical protein